VSEDVFDRALDRRNAVIEDQRRRIKALEEALRDCLGWHDYADDLHKPVEVRAAYVRARKLLKEADQ
jgi:hypothetical protein